ncbi:hypothetical protein OPV22_015295 [Ensete ventricosum]|uniref:Uncharacterized protein n=1 Tax=Ensete ventricosum TaxID=4639 RepID=A0AAV8R5A0_ENSVE|nr:hypothetical protein OPV22_015295 [Ensete ventricosum]RWV80683.1 hypothetical protein GW17_00058007 [Ensete ventricosum]RWW37904.1 hypothetical protein BHE74_00056919 [Ensete ventricosum]RZS17196.1 hypothetical protein BHM03_00049315 [Ensete ventricosum]
MKRGRAEAGLPSSKAAAVSPAKAQRRQKGSTTKASAAAGRTRQAAMPDRARKGSRDNKGPAAAAAAAADLQQSSTAPVAPAEVDVVGWVDGAGELGDSWWGLWGVEEDKLSGWFPFVDEDFLCSDARGGELSGGLLWEEASYHDIWQLQHIYEIPQAASN